MKVFRGFNHPGIASACALTIGNFDGVHLGHQAMLALLQGHAQQRGLPSCVLTFEPHPRDYFAQATHKPELAPTRIGTLRDKLMDLARAGIDQAVVLPFNARLAALPPQVFVDDVLVRGLGAKYVLVGDDFRFGAKRAGDYAMLETAGRNRPEQTRFDVARMDSFELPDSQAGQSLRVSSSAVRDALADGRMADAARLLGRPYRISGHVVHGRKLGRELGFSTLNMRFSHWKPAASGIFVVNVYGLGQHANEALPGVANLGVRPSLDADDVNGGRVLLETHCLDWPAALGRDGGYGKIVSVELLHKLHGELKYDGLEALTTGIAKDCGATRAWFAANLSATPVSIQSAHPEPAYREPIQARI